MPSKISLGFPDPGIGNTAKLRAGARLARVVSALNVTYCVVHIAYWLVVGGFLMVFPWQSIWENNYVLLQYPNLRPFIVSPYMKGAVLGLGIVNLLIGLQEIANFRKNSRSYLPR